MQRNRKYHVMSFGLGGNGAECTEPDFRDPNKRSTMHSSWYLKPEEMQTYIDNGHYPADEMEGCILINKIPALEKSYSTAFTSPMCNPLLDDDEIDKFNTHAVDSIMLPVIAANFGVVGALAIAAIHDDTISGFDFVSPRRYAAIWKGYGATIGIVKGGKVIWDI